MAQLQGIVTVSQVGEMKFDLNEPDVPIGEFLGHIGKRLLLQPTASLEVVKALFMFNWLFTSQSLGLKKPKKL